MECRDGSMRGHDAKAGRCDGHRGAQEAGVIGEADSQASGDVPEDGAQVPRGSRGDRTWTAAG